MIFESTSVHAHVTSRTRQKNKIYVARLSYLDPITKEMVKKEFSLKTPVEISNSGREKNRATAELAAVKKAEEWKQELLRGEIATEISRQKRTIEEIGDEWFKTHQKEKIKDGDPLAPSTVDNYAYALKKVYSFFCGKPIAKITTDDIISLIDNYDEIYSSSWVHKIYLVLNKSLQYAYTECHIRENPCWRVRNPPKNRAKEVLEEEVFTDDEMKRILKAVAGTDLEIPVIIAAFLGLRRSEVLGLRWSAIDFVHDSIMIERTFIEVSGKKIDSTKTKTRSSRKKMPLDPKLKSYLLNLKKKQEENKELCGNCWTETGAVCIRADGTRILPNYVSDTFPKLVESLGIRRAPRADGQEVRLTFHSIRHYVATSLLRKGYSMHEVSLFLRHASVQITMDRYAHLGYNDIVTVHSAVSADFDPSDYAD